MKKIIMIVLVGVMLIGSTAYAAGFYKNKYLNEDNTTVYLGQALSEISATVVRIDDNGVSCFVAGSKNGPTGISCVTLAQIKK